MISPFRHDVLLTGFVLAVPVPLLALRGDFTVEDVGTRLLWCLAAGWAAVALLRWASTPPAPPRGGPGTTTGPEPESEPAATA